MPDLEGEPGAWLERSTFPLGAPPGYDPGMFPQHVSIWASLILGPLLAPMSLVSPTAHVGPTPEQDEPVQEAPGLRPEVLDEAYRFRLTQPSEGWTLLDEASIRSILGDALAGGCEVQDGGAWFAVLAQHMPGVSIEAATTSFLDSMLQGSGSPESVQDVTFAGQPARRYHVLTEEAGQPIGYVGFVYAKGDHIFQVTCWGPRGKVAPDSELIHKIEAAYTVLDGPVTATRTREDVGDQYGVGWSLASDVFTSTAYGFRAQFDGDWRSIAGSPLKQLDPGAELGFEHVQLEAYGSIVCETVDPENSANHLASLQNEFREGFEQIECNVTVSMFGKGVRLMAYRDSAAVPFIYFRALAEHEGTVMEFVVWALASRRVELERVLRQRFPSITRLSPEERAAAQLELDARPDPENIVTAGQSLRRGVFRDHAAGILWTKPKGLWRVSPGETDAGVDAEFRVEIFNPQLGVSIVVLATPTRQTPEQGLFTLMEFFAGDLSERPEVLEWTVGEHAGLHADLARDNGIHLRFLSVPVEGTTYDVVVQGPQGHMRNAREPIGTLLKSFRFGAGITPAIQEMNGLHWDHRLGYALSRPAEDWTKSTVPIPGGEAVGSGVQYSRGGEEIYVVAFCVPTGMDMAALQDLMAQGIGGSLEPFGQPTQVPFQGLTATQRAFDDGHAQMLFVQREKTLYLLGANSELRPANLEDTLKLFAFTD